MALVVGYNALSTTAERLTATSALLADFELRNNDGSIAVYIGASDAVTNTTGFLLPAGATYRARSLDPSKLFAIAASGTPAVSWIGSN